MHLVASGVPICFGHGNVVRSSFSNIELGFDAPAREVCPVEIGHDGIRARRRPSQCVMRLPPGETDGFMAPGTFL